jgi:hypothetical protein
VRDSGSREKIESNVSTVASECGGNTGTFDESGIADINEEVKAKGMIER